MATLEMNLQNFESTVENNDIVLIDFWASWCGPCRMFGPIYEKVSERHADVTFAKVNTEEEQGIAMALRIEAIPTLMVFRDGVLLFNQAGALPPAALEDLITQVKGLNMDEVRAQINAHSHSHDHGHDCDHDHNLEH